MIPSYFCWKQAHGLYSKSVFVPNAACSALLWCWNLAYPTPHISPDRRRQCLGHIWLSDWCVPGSRNQSSSIWAVLFFLTYTSVPLDLSPGFFSLGHTMDGNLFISPDTKGPDGISSCGEHRRLACGLLLPSGCPGQPVSALPAREVEAELTDGKSPHGALLSTLILSCDGKQEEYLCIFFSEVAGCWPIF